MIYTGSFKNKIKSLVLDYFPDNVSYYYNKGFFFSILFALIESRSTLTVIYKSHRYNVKFRGHITKIHASHIVPQTSMLFKHPVSDFRYVCEILVSEEAFTCSYQFPCHHHHQLPLSTWDFWHFYCSLQSIFKDMWFCNVILTPCE